MRAPRVLLVSKSECPLCDEAKHALEVVGGEIPFALEVRRIEDDEALRAAHALEVPVVFIDGKKMFFGKVSPLLLRRELRAAAGVSSARVKPFLGVGVFLVLGLAVATAIALLQQQRQRRRVVTTLKRLRDYARWGRRWGQTSSNCWIYLGTGPVLPEQVRRDDALVACDAWGNPIIFRRPGFVHPKGFDLYSVGPNGIDEHGAGDDIVVGDDVAPVAS